MNVDLSTREGMNAALRHMGVNKIQTIVALREVSATKLGLKEAKDIAYEFLKHVNSEQWRVSFGIDGAFGTLTRIVQANDYDTACDAARHDMYPTHIINVDAERF